MKRKNKETGEIAHFEIYKIAGLSDDGNPIYEPFKGNIEEWEDYEEPENFYIVEQRGTVGSRFRTGAEYEKKFKEIGNYFETKEEAEKAVEKLKAFANLRKMGLKFNGWDEADRGMVGEFAIYCDALELDGIERELEIVFGREEL